MNTPILIIFYLGLIIGLIMYFTRKPKDTKSKFDSIMQQSDLPAISRDSVLIFFAPWCGHCARAKAEFEKARRGGRGDIHLIDATDPDNKKIVVMTTTLNALKGQLKLDPKLSIIANEEKKKGSKKDKKQNKKNTYNQREQNKDEAWKKEPPKDGEKHEKEVGKYMYHWCEHHMAWTVHKPANCLLGKQHKEDQKKKPHKANSGSFAAAAATATLSVLGTSSALADRSV
jgi:thiol-disulfide isomerase/thioredoxin